MKPPIRCRSKIFMKKILVLFLCFMTLQSVCVYGAVNKKKVFNKLDKQEKLSMLKSMKRQELSQINSRIKDVKSSIKSVEESADIPLNVKQSKLLTLNRELTELTTRKAELERMYKLKINSVKGN